MKQGREICLALLFISLLLLTACPNTTNGDNLTPIPDSATLTYTDISAPVDQAITTQTPVFTGLSANDITFIYSITPELPTGLTIDAATGEIGGTPTAVQNSTKYTITATAQGLYTGSIKTTISIQIYAAGLTPIPDSATLTYTGISASVDQAITTQTPVFTGLSAEDITFIYSITPELPTGLTLDTATGEIGGTPTAVQALTTHTITATAQGLYTGSIETTISIQIHAAGLTPIPGTATLTYTGISASIDQAITTQTPDFTGLPAEDITFIYSITPELPTGLTIDENTGEISGTPTAVYKTTEHTITATAQPPYVGTVEAAISIGITGTIPTSATFTYADISATVDQAITTQTPDFTNLPAEDITFIYSITPELPADLNLDENTGELRGTPTAVQNSTDYTITATAQDPYVGTVEAAISIGITGTIPTSATFTYADISASVDQAITTQTPDFTGLPANDITFIYSITPDLPEGLTLDENTGEIWGTPTAEQSLTTHTITAEAQGLYTGSIETTIRIGIYAATLTLIPSTASLNGYSDIAISFESNIGSQFPDISDLPTNESITFMYSIHPELPEGLTLDTATGELRGTPTAVHKTTEHTITATAQSPHAGFVSAAINIGVSQSIGTTATFLGYSNMNAIVGEAITSQIPKPLGLSVENIPFIYSIQPELPAGLILDKNTGELRGTPTTPKISTRYTITATAQDPYIGSINAAISIEITKAIPAEVTLTGYTDISASLGDEVPPQNPTLSGLPAENITFAYSIDPPLPAGWTIDETTGALGGTTAEPYKSTSHIITATAQAPYTGAVEAAISIGVSQAIPPNTATLTYPRSHYESYIGGHLDPISRPGPSPAFSGLPAEDISFTYSAHPPLPAGLLFIANTGIITGYFWGPVQVSTEYTITATAQDPYTGTVEGKISITVARKLSTKTTISYQDIVAIVGEEISPQNPSFSNLKGHNPTFTYSITPDIPNGMMLDENTGELSGTPTAIQGITNYEIAATPLYPYTFGATTNSKKATITIKISKRIPASAALTGYSNIATAVNQSITEQSPDFSGLPAEENIIFTYAIHPELPAGMEFDKDTGKISGSPTTPQRETNHTITATAQEPYIGLMEAPISITIAGPVPASVMLTYSDIDVFQGDGIAQQSPAFSGLPAGGMEFTSYSIDPDLPPGLSLNETTGVLSGTATGVQDSTDYTITATADYPYDGNVKAKIAIVVYDENLDPIPGTVTFTGYSEIKILKDNAITSQYPAFSNRPRLLNFSYSVSPDLPPGLTLNENTGKLSGIPTAGEVPTDYTIKASALDPYAGNLRTTISITVYKAQAADKAHLRTLIDEELAANGSLNLIDTSLVLDMSGLFENQPSFNEDISAWNVSNVTTMARMFAGAEAFNQRLNSWNVSSVRNMKSMFNGATAFNQNLDSWNVEAVTDMSHMFNGATAFNQNLDSWNVSSVRNMKSMFNGATSFNQDLDSWNVEAITDMSHMFDGAQAFNGDVSSWNVSVAVKNMSYMFANATAFNGNLDSWYPQYVEDMSYMFYNATSFNQPVFPGAANELQSLRNSSHMFEGATAFNQDVKLLGTVNQDVSYMFANATAFNGDLVNLSLRKVQTMSHMFSGATSFNRDIAPLFGNHRDLDGVPFLEDMSYMFAGATSFNQDLSDWGHPLTYFDIDGVTNMSHMFDGATAFNGDISTWDVQNVTDMSGMFAGTESFNGDITGWDVSSVINMGYMFNGAAAFNQDLEPWGVAAVVNTDEMFTDSAVDNIPSWYSQ